MWYRVAIDLSNLKSFSPVETATVSTGSGVQAVPEKIVSVIDSNRDRIDAIYHLGGLDPDSEEFKKIAHNIVDLCHTLSPLLSSIIRLIRDEKPLHFLVRKQFGLNSILADLYHIVDMCDQLELQKDPEVRVSKFIEYFKASGGMHGFFTAVFSVFNSISKFLKFLGHIDIHSPVDLPTFFMGFATIEYFLEETREEEHKSGVSLLKTRVINPSLEFLKKKNPKNIVIIKYVKNYIKKNPDLSHGEVRDHVLDYFLGGERNKKFRNIPGGKFYYLDIVHIVDLLYDDPHDLHPWFAGKRINKEYHDNLMDFLHSADAIQMKILKATLVMQKLLLMLPHV
jgi:hypothetical protein